MGVFEDDGIRVALDNVTAGELATAKLRLYSNNLTPTNAQVIGDFTEATFTGYAAVTLSGWTAASVAAHVASSTANPVTFTLTAGTQSIYGWYITNAAGTVLYAAGRDAAAPVAMSLTVNNYQVTVTVSAAS